MPQKEQRNYRYKHLELALANVFDVTMAGLAAFRARIRHLRNLGVPTGQNPGKGTAITYTRDDAILLLIALEVELFGLPPKFAASFARSNLRQIVVKADLANRSGRHLILSYDPSFAFDANQAAIFLGDPKKPDLPLLDQSTHRHIVIDIAKSIALLDSYLASATGVKTPATAILESYRSERPRITRTEGGSEQKHGKKRDGATRARVRR